MKKFFRGLLIALVVFIILPVALIFIFFFDTSKLPVKYDDDFTAETWSQNMVVDSLDVTKSEKKARFAVSEEDINNFINSELKKNKELQKYLTQFAIDIQEDSYVLNVSGKAFFFETRAKLTAKLSKEDIFSEGNEEGKEAFVLSVEKMSLGRLTQLKTIIMFFLKRFVNDQTVDALASSIKLHADLKNSRLFIYTDDLRDMINQGVNGGSGTSEFYFAFINDFLDNNLVNIDFYGGESLTVDIDLEPLTGNDYDASVGENVYYPMNYEATTTKLMINGEEKKLSLDTIRDALVVLLNKNKITYSETNQISGYLFNGYKVNNVPTADLTEIGIPVKEAYQGFNLVDSSSIDDIFKTSISTFDGYSPSLNSFDIADLKESQINLFLKSQSVLGHKYFMHREVSDGVYKINYIALDNAYMNFYGDTAIISVGLNINGLETMVTMKMVLDDSNHDDSQLVYLPDKIYFGKESRKLKMSAETEKVVFETLADAVNDSTFKFDRNGKMTISFTSIIDQAINSISLTNPYRAFLMADADISIKVEGNAITDNSSIKIQAVRKS